MKRKEFVKIVINAMKLVDQHFDDSGYFTCNAISKAHMRDSQGLHSSVRKDYIKVFCRFKKNEHLEVCFGLNRGYDKDFIKQVRLNALAMYLVQSLAFGTYKEL